MVSSRRTFRVVLLVGCIVCATVIFFGSLFADANNVKRAMAKHMPIFNEGAALDEDLAFLKKQSAQGANAQGRVFPAAGKFKSTALPSAKHNYTITVVTGKKKNDDTNWLDEELPQFRKVVYVVDDHTAKPRPPKNKGNEAMVYLSYIIDNYISLSDISVFVHSSRWAWHNNDVFGSDIAEAVRHLIPQAVIRAGYVNLRCQWSPGCPEWIKPRASSKDILKTEEQSVKAAWPHLFPGEELPETLAQPCCSQFALSKDRIRAIPLTEYERLRAWLLETPLEDHIVGRVFEYAWQVLWTGHSILCPGQHACHCDLFGVCFEDEADFQSWFELKYYMKRDQIEWEEWHGQLATVQDLVKSGRRTEAKKLELPPLGRIQELRYAVDGRWIELMERKAEALERGKNGKYRAQVAGREADLGDLG